MKSGMSFLIIFLAMIIAVPYVKAAAPENPVHERRKAYRLKHTEYYKGQRIIDSDEEKKAAEEKEKEKQKKSNKGEKNDKERLAELMKEFDKDGDGAISPEEMKAAQTAGKDQELQTLLDKEKEKKDKAKKSKKSGVKGKPQSPKASGM